MDVKFQDNSDLAIQQLHEAVNRILEAWGIKLERWAKKLCPVGTVESTGKKGYRGGTLRNSITHEVNENEKSVSYGSDVEYAPYVELGTGPYFEAPPDWETFDSAKGKGTGHSYVHARPFLRPAAENHVGELKNIMLKELSKP